MRKALLSGVAAATLIVVTAAAPAFAATETVTTVSTHTVPADVAIEIPYDYAVWGDAGAFAIDGSVAFPLTAIQYDGDFSHHTFAMSATASAGCVRVVTSFTFDYTLADNGGVSDPSVPLAGGIGAGEPLAFAPLGTANVIHGGDGTVNRIDGERVWVDLDVLPAPAPPQSGTVTMSYTGPVAPEQARGYIGFGTPDVTTWVVDRASFLVTDTCSSQVAIPAVAAPPVLPATGAESGIAGALAAAFLAVGIAGLALARRPTTRAGER
ncbi:LPXTG cell wall anchor domain-containing protein [Homoserinimonas hongtaonis]|uniref:Gram-positive cocci surface proteins LPxTG domain-containing protein n=1 Tax=Homoserinimonas hongtaonis TaxID=2079791 RepID=A0A2U1T0U8_9MICO|nr:LPXTG cell wall anchor domain-containing protein [Salinibacterium hongtaonis]PWB97403.1 hypothetical protein DF220_05850 [Salinibacterium hongtaonis]